MESRLRCSNAQHNCPGSLRGWLLRAAIHDTSWQRTGFRARPPCGVTSGVVLARVRKPRFWRGIGLSATFTHEAVYHAGAIAHHQESARSGKRLARAVCRGGIDPIGIAYPVCAT